MSAPDAIPPHHSRHAALDGLRGVAVLAVLVMHFSVLQASTAGERYFRSVVDVGWAGVDLFFVLSGFLITGILWDARGGSHYFRGFFMRRTLRIFPLYYAYLALVLVLAPLLSANYAAEHLPVDQRPWLWGYLSNVLMARVGWEGMPSHTTHLWSLAVEEQFYLIWPFLIAFVSRRGAVWLCAIAIAFATVARVGFTLGMDWPVASYVLMPARIDSLAIGGLLALGVRHEATLAWLRQHARSIAMVLFGALLLLAGALDTFGREALLPPMDPRVQLLGYPLVGLFCGSLLLLAYTGTPGAVLTRALTTRPMLVLGKYSYALYLLHIPLRNATRSFVDARGGVPIVAGSRIPAQLLLLVVCIGLSLIAAICSWHLFEKHFLRLKERFPYDAQPRAPEPRVVIATSSEEQPVAL